MLKDEQEILLAHKLVELVPRLDPIRPIQSPPDDFTEVFLPHHGQFFVCVSCLVRSLLLFLYLDANFRHLCTFLPVEVVTIEGFTDWLIECSVVGSLVSVYYCAFKSHLLRLFHQFEALLLRLFFHVLDRLRHSLKSSFKRPFS